MEFGKLNTPITGIMCHNLAGPPISAITKAKHINNAATAIPSPINTACLKSIFFNT